MSDNEGNFKLFVVTNHRPNARGEGKNLPESEWQLRTNCHKNYDQNKVYKNAYSTVLSCILSAIISLRVPLNHKTMK